MDTELLRQIGLSKPQALTYRALVLKNGAKPALIAKLIGESRANTYAILDKLIEMGIVYREDVNKKYVYFPDSPQKLEVLVANKIAHEQRQLKKLQKRMPEMITAYSADKNRPTIEIVEGKEKVLQALSAPDKQKGKEQYLVHTRSDLAAMSTEKMKLMRYSYVNKKIKRHAISTFAEYKINEAVDRQGLLSRTYVDQEDYDQPVEWSVYGDTVSITLYEGDTYNLKITNKRISKSFEQLLLILTKAQRATPGYEGKYTPEKPKDEAELKIRAANDKSKYLNKN